MIAFVPVTYSIHSFEDKSYTYRIRAQREIVISNADKTELARNLFYSR